MSTPDVDIFGPDGNEMLEVLATLDDTKDVVFKFTDSPDWNIHAHKLILAGWSHKFQNMLYLDPNYENVVDLKDINPVIFSTLIDFLYAKPLEFICIEQAMDFYDVASEFDITVEPVLKYLESQINRRNCIEIYELAVDYELDEIIEMCLKAFTLSTWHIINSAQFLSASPNTINVIYSLKSLRNISELNLCIALHNWVGAQAPDTIEEKLNAVTHAIRSIRFLQIKPSYADAIMQLNFLHQDQKLGIVKALCRPGEMYERYPDFFCMSWTNRKTKTPKVYCMECEEEINIKRPRCSCCTLDDDGDWIYTDEESSSGESKVEDEPKPVQYDEEMCDKLFEEDHDRTLDTDEILDSDSVEDFSICPDTIDMEYFVRDGSYICNATGMLDEIRVLTDLQDVFFMFPNHCNRVVGAFKLILAGWSEIFYRMFYGPERTVENKVEITEFEPDVFEKTIDLFNGELISFKSASEAAEMLEICEQFELPTGVCMDYLTSARNCIDAYEVSIRYDLECVTDWCLDKFESRTYRLIKEDQFLSASAETVNTIFSGKLCNVTAKMMCKALTRWLQAQEGELADEIKKVKPAIHQIRFLTMTSEDLEYVGSLMFLADEEKHRICHAIAAEDIASKLFFYPSEFSCNMTTYDSSQPKETCEKCDTSIDEDDFCKTCIDDFIGPTPSHDPNHNPPFYSKKFVSRRVTGLPLNAVNPYGHDFSNNIVIHFED